MRGKPGKLSRAAEIPTSIPSLSTSFSFSFSFSLLLLLLLLLSWGPHATFTRRLVIPYTASGGDPFHTYAVSSLLSVDLDEVGQLIPSSGTPSTSSSTSFFLPF